LYKPGAVCYTEAGGDDTVPITRAAAPTTRTLGRLTGPARCDRRTKNLAARLRPGDIAVIDHADLDALAARALVDARVLAVINAQPFITGRYPNRGPAVLLAERIPIFSLPAPDLLPQIVEGQRLTIDEGGCLYAEDRPLCTLVRWDENTVAEATEAARTNLGRELEKFARNTLQYLDADKDLLLDPTDVPAVPGLKIAGRHALVVVRGEGYKEDLGELRPYIRDARPVVIAVDGAADALLAFGHRPDIILGDMDSVSDAALRCGAQLIVHAYARRGGEAPGLARVQALGLPVTTFAVPGTSEDAALLLAYEHNADLIVAVGTHSNLEDFLDKGRAGMASTFLTRLKVGSRLVDARGVFKIYRPAPPLSLPLAVILSALFPLAVLMRHAPLWSNLVSLLRVWWRLHIR
jgi:uncharacterized membrane-anchored protein